MTPIFLFVLLSSSIRSSTNFSACAVATGGEFLMGVEIYCDISTMLHQFISAEGELVVEELIVAEMWLL